MTQHPKLTFLALLALCLPCSSAWAWHDKGHEAATGFALAALPDDVPAFFREGGEVVRGAVTEPDMFTKPVAPWELHAAEAQEHFFDIEFLADGHLTLKATRFEFLEQCYDKQIKPYRVGLAPYAVMEWTHRLTIAFAQHRRWPEDKAIQQKCLLYAGFLAHYAQDLCQPLHTSIHYDGRVAKLGDPSPRSGIHNKVDALPGKLDAKPDDVLKDLKIQPLIDRTAEPATSATSQPATNPARTPNPPSPLLKAILTQIEANHKLVDRVYELEKDLPGMHDPLPEDSHKVRAFALERLRESTRFSASLLLTAWRESEFIEIPAWHRGKHE